MNENMVEVLIYLYENYLDGNGAPAHRPGRARNRALARRLRQRRDRAGADLARRAGAAHGHRGVSRAHRRFDARLHRRRVRKLDIEARGLLLFLEQSGILDPLSRELVIDRAMAIEQTAVSVDELKWVVLLVLMNRPGRESAHSQMEELIYSDAPAQLH
jgi:Smg protein